MMFAPAKNNEILSLHVDGRDPAVIEGALRAYYTYVLHLGDGDDQPDGVFHISISYEQCSEASYVS
ncbi:MAG: hypothetical protein ACYCTG_04945 [Ferrimicrobium sp.]